MTSPTEHRFAADQTCDSWSSISRLTNEDTRLLGSLHTPKAYIHLTCMASTLYGGTNVDPTYLCKIRVVQIAVLGRGGIKGRVELVTRTVVGGLVGLKVVAVWDGAACAVEIAALWNTSEGITVKSSCLLVPVNARWDDRRHISVVEPKTYAGRKAWIRLKIHSSYYFKLYTMCDACVYVPKKDLHVYRNNKNKYHANQAHHLMSIPSHLISSRTKRAWYTYPKDQ